MFFTVRAKQELPTGTEVRNHASIVFDFNAPILTPEWVNTIDKDRPTSQVAPLPATVPDPTFTVSWNGTDVGSGVQDFSVYVSDSGGSFNPFVTNASATSATFNGQRGHTYAFYVLARDLVGNTEGPKTVAEATTTVLQDTTAPLITLSPSTSTLWPPNGELVPVHITGKVTDDGSGVNPSTATFVVADEYGLVEPSGPIAVMPDGSYTFTAMLEARRLGQDPDGRQYRVTVTADDQSGNRGSASTLVVVSHDQRRD